MTEIKESYIIYFLIVYYIMANPFSIISLFPNKEEFSQDGEVLPKFSGYQFRFTCDGELQTQILDFMLRNSTGEFICSRENGTQNGREHIQGYCEFEITKKSFMNKFNEKFKKQLETRDKYLDKDKGHTRSYVCKGVEPQQPFSPTNPYILSSRALTSTIENNYINYWSNAQKINTVYGHKDKQIIIANFEESLQVATLKKQKKMQFLQGLTFKIRSMKPDDYKWSRSKDLGFVYRHTKRGCGEAVKIFNKYRLAEMVNGVLNSLIGEDELDDWLWFQECFPNETNLYFENHTIKLN